jgi:hypothetical protein
MSENQRLAGFTHALLDSLLHFGSQLVTEIGQHLFALIAD